ncbi:restriction endonuclease subunit S [Escherichia coli]|uniref:restriction endonuclease subunit S n=1 Tax=unclassified Providencia TaxID=2633465 RepID=UPI0013DF43DA|nr:MULTISPECIES: restriction endonuclease subunit S [unclassified Providencia]ELX5872237.1 restriction endonuclease subunit S [Escherichia coli]QIF56671.1 restriction endonuclease subunit S [Providencia sp. 1701011]QIF60719.1 restriction endonuclease subunit S [Providencia sp. 1701091]
MSVEVTETGLNLIPAGYKQTEVGVIPEDWDAVCLGDISEVRMCKRILSGQTKKIGAIPFFKIGTFGGEPDAYITHFLYKEFKAKYSFPNKGDILVSAAGTLGKSVVYDGKPAYFQDSNIVWLEVNKYKLLNEYLYHYYKIIKWASSEGSTIARLYNGIIRASIIALPKINEQIAIATALSDVDALISELEKLIAKKQAIKTATMQQLLTGRTRLPQFALREDGTPKGTKPSELGEIPEDWEILGLGALFQPSVSKKPIKPKSLVSFVGMQDVTEQAQLSTQHLLAIENVKSGFTYFERGDVLVAKITPCFENGKGCHTETLSTDIGFGSTEFHVLRATDNSDSRFIYYWSNRNVFRKSLESEMVGSAGHRRVPLSAIAKYTIPVPPKEEQTAIATILSDMDDEIQALEQRLGKTRQIKQGMMQELLTGKTRLPYDKE